MPPHFPLPITRAAIWKAVNSLRDDGYVIDAVRNRGYRLSQEVDFLSELGIMKYLDADSRMLDIHVLREVGSTNAVLREKASAGAPEGTVLVAAMQTDGKGRLGRRFYSPADTGIYLSLLLRPVDMAPEQALHITTMAAVAACESIEDTNGKPAQIKWVNDVYQDGRKIAGILTEGVLSMESGLMDSIVLGIGINVYPPEEGFPKEIESIAGAVLDEKQTEAKNRIAAGFLNHFLSIYHRDDTQTYVHSYRERSMVIGKKVTVISGKDQRSAYVLDVDEECRLLVRYEEGSEERLTGGEISLKI